ncbi:Fc.00g081800.m01.CDS01 [Cosmosporella sp. VM-42]
MESETPQHWLRNCTVHTAWSAQVIVEEVLLALKTDDRTFYGVRTTNRDHRPWIWPRPHLDGLLWVVEDGLRLWVWQECRQAPWIGCGEGADGVEQIVGQHRQPDTGLTYVGVKWKGYECPTWELESEVDQLLLSPGAVHVVEEVKS